MSPVSSNSPFSHMSLSQTKKRVRTNSARYTKLCKFVAESLKLEAKDLLPPEASRLLIPPVGKGGRPSYELELRSYVPLARELAGKGSFSVTGAVIDAIDLIVELRRENNNMCDERLIGTAVQRKNHKYALHVFEQVREILCPNLKSRVEPVTPSAVPDTLYLPTSLMDRKQSEREEIDAEWSKPDDMSETQAARENISLATAATKSSFFLEGLKRIRHSLQRCWYRRKVGVNDGNHAGIPFCSLGLRKPSLNGFHSVQDLYNGHVSPQQ